MRKMFGPKCSLRYASNEAQWNRRWRRWLIETPSPPHRHHNRSDLPKRLRKKYLPFCPPLTDDGRLRVVTSLSVKNWSKQLRELHRKLVSLFCYFPFTISLMFTHTIEVEKYHLFIGKSNEMQNSYEVSCVDHPTNENSGTSRSNGHAGSSPETVPSPKSSTDSAFDRGFVDQVYV